MSTFECGIRLKFVRNVLAFSEPSNFLKSKIFKTFIPDICIFYLLNHQPFNDSLLLFINKSSFKFSSRYHSFARYSKTILRSLQYIFESFTGIGIDFIVTLLFLIVTWNALDYFSLTCHLEVIVKSDAIMIIVIIMIILKHCRNKIKIAFNCIKSTTQCSKTTHGVAIGMKRL